MKLSTFLVGVAVCTTTTFLLSCQKDESLNPPGSELKNLRLSGVVEDDPAMVAKVPMIVSAEFLKLNPNFSAPILNARGKPDNTLPNVSITAPSSNSTVAGTVNVKANASDNVGVTLVSLSVDGSLVATTSTAPYSIPWNSAAFTNGSHNLTVTAKDAAGNSRSATIQVTVSNTGGGDITNPTVSITSPSNGSSVSGTVNVQANANDNVGVSSVSFSVGGTVIGIDNSAPYSFSWNTASVATGSHNLTATASDAAGNSASHAIQVTINTVVLPPSTLPASFQLLTPTPGNQGAEGSCVAFAIGYGARSIEQFYKTNATTYITESNIFSPEYIYNQTKFSDCGSGTAFTIVLDLLKNQGVSTWQSMPYSDVNGCALQPTSSQLANASAFKISSYSSIPHTDHVAIKTMIASKHPVIVNITADNSFVNAGPGFIWRSYSGSGALPHAIIICGYDDSKHAYKIMNSYGTAWGDAGFSWIDYDFFVQKSSFNTYVLQ